MTSPLTVIVPVYRGADETQRCLRSLLASADHAATDIIVVNDASPEPDLTEYCRATAAEHSLNLIEHQVNQGFVKSVNEAMRLAGTSDVVLLNSDTEVPANWIERISKAAAAHPDAASITPFSNNATICSYPHFGVENALPPGYDTHTLDALFASANQGKTFDIPTGVGFCMFIRRAALEDVGYFDEEAFGLGYGEENDWCLRASSKGWRHLLCADLFVYHSGEVSFGEKARELQANALSVIRERYPQYEQTVARFIEQDPIESARYAVDRLRSELQDVVGEYRDRERKLREAYYALRYASP
jgi:GT2 family glycosyltransferase